MKRTILSGLAISALLIGASAAHAADMPVKVAAPPPPAPVNSWTGLYFDVAAGWERNSYNWNDNAAPGPFDSAFSLSSTDGVVGGHIGYQQQFSWLVVGGEIGASGTFNSKFANAVSAGAGLGAVCGIAIAGSICRTSIGDVSTVGGKLGVAWQDWLFYGVGGAAFGANVNSQVAAPGGLSLLDFAAPQNARGWYAGGGFDFMTFKTQLIDMILGVEYRHIDLGTTQQFDNVNGFAPGAFQRAIGAKEDIVWAKLTVKWNPLGM